MSSSIGLIVLIIYHSIGKKHEKKLVAEKKVLLEKIKKEEEDKKTGNKEESALEELEQNKLHSDKMSALSFAGSWVSGNLLTTKF